MEVNIKYGKHFFSAERNNPIGENPLEEGLCFCEANREFVEKKLLDYVFVNAGPELNRMSIIRLPIYNLHKRILALYFEFVGYTPNKLVVILKEVKYHSAFPPKQDEEIPGNGSNNHKKMDINKIIIKTQKL